jgi:hypothetical protein
VWERAVTSGSKASASRAAALRVVSLLLLFLLTNRPITPAQSGAPGAARRSNSSRPVGLAANSRLAVDVVKLRSGKTLRGTIAHSESDGSLTMAVSREWLRQSDPKALTSVEADESRTRLAALKQLGERIKQELAKIPEDSGLAVFLRTEAKRVGNLLTENAPGEPPQFVWLELPKKKIAKVVPTTSERKQVAGWSWYEKLANVETHDVEDLERELRAKRIDPTQAVPDLSERVPLRMQDEREWSARMALVADALGNPVRFEGSGDYLARSRRSPNANKVAATVAKNFADYTEARLKQMLEDGPAASTASKSPDAWLATAIKESEEEKARAFRATTLDIRIEPREVTVRSAFVVQPGNGKWEIVWSDRDTEDGTQPRPAAEATIASDPQIRSALRIFKAFGANGGNDRIPTAIRFGAATQVAQQAVDQHFSRFQEPFLRQLDGPPLWLPR